MSGRPQTIVMVTGAVSGLGKTSLCRRLAERLTASGWDVELFEESDMTERREFADVMASFRVGGFVPIEQLLDAADRYLETCRASNAGVFVQDMLLPYLPSLLAWGHSDAEIAEFFVELARSGRDFDLVQIHLQGDPARSIPRAAEREGAGWLEGITAKVGNYADLQDPVTDLPSLVQYFDHAQRRTERLLEATPWPVFVIDSELGPDAVADRAFEALRLVKPDRPA